MTRDEALQWCVKHVEEWPEGFTLSFAPDGWEWVLVISPGNRHTSLMKIADGAYISSSEIDSHHWLKAKSMSDVTDLFIKQCSMEWGVPIYMLTGQPRIPQPDTTPCGQSFHDLMRDLSA